jgi:hypothetical protein
MNNRPLPQGKILGCRSHGSGATAKGREKFLSAKIRRNPLISLDPDERIQGNPRNSNPQNWGLCSKTAMVQENPNRPDQTKWRAAMRELDAPNRAVTPSVCHAVKISLLATVESGLSR